MHRQRGQQQEEGKAHHGWKLRGKAGSDRANRRRKGTRVWEMMWGLRLRGGGFLRARGGG